MYYYLLQGGVHHAYIKNDDLNNSKEHIDAYVCHEGVTLKGPIIFDHLP